MKMISTASSKSLTVNNGNLSSSARSSAAIYGDENDVPCDISYRESGQATQTGSGGANTDMHFLLLLASIAADHVPITRRSIQCVTPLDSTDKDNSINGFIAAIFLRVAC